MEALRRRGRPPRGAEDSAGAVLTLGLVVSSLIPTAVGLSAQEGPDRLRDRGAGVPVSMFGTYITEGEVLFYPFFEMVVDRNAEYSPAELGFGPDQDFRAKHREYEGLVFLAYGISDRLAVEFEAAVISAWLDKAVEDTTGRPQRIKESGLGDVEGQIRWFLAPETDRRPGIFSILEVVFPLQKNRLITGTQDWEFKLGMGFVRGFGFGTMTLRLSTEYDRGEGKLETGEYALEFLRRVSPRLRVYAGVEGSEDEVEVIPEVQIFLRPNIFLKLNSAFGVTSKGPGWAPEVGVMFSFR